MKQIIVKSDCIKCGMCFSDSDFFIQDELGYSKIANSNLIEDEAFEEIRDIIENCPTNAIEVINLRGETNAVEVVSSKESNEKKVLSKCRRNKRFSLLKMFGNLDLDEIDDPDMISSQLLEVIKSKENNIYRKLERKVRDTVEDVLDEEDDYVEMNRHNYYIECAMNIKDHRLKMDRVKLNYYFNISNNVLNIDVNENSFEVSINKAILVKIFLLTALYEKYGESINELSYKDIVSSANNFVRKDFNIFNEYKPTALTIVLGTTLAAIASEAAVRAAVESSVEAVVSTARDAWKSERDVMDKVVENTVIEAAFNATIKASKEAVFEAIVVSGVENNSSFYKAVELTFNTALEPAFNATVKGIRDAAAAGRTYSNFIFMNFNFHESAIEAAFNKLVVSDGSVRAASEVLKKMGYDEAINTAKVATIDLSRDLAIEAAKEAILNT